MTVALLQNLARGAEALFREGGYLLVDGTAFQDLPESVALPGGAHAGIRRASSELHVRHALWQARGAPTIVLVPAGLALPADLVEGAARHKVHTVTDDEILTGVFGTRVVGVDDVDLRSLALDHAEQIIARLATRTTPTVIDRRLLERTLVEVVAELIDLRLSDAEPATLLATWASNPPRWSPAVKRLASSTLAERGDPGKILAWALEQAEVRMPALVVRGAVLSGGGEFSPDAKGTIGELERRSTELRLDPHRVVDHVVHLARSALARLVGAGRESLLEQADAIARRTLSTSQTRNSDLLPLAFREVAHDVARRVAAGDPDAQVGLLTLGKHTLAGLNRREIDLLTEMVRLSRYLATPVDVPAHPAGWAHTFAFHLAHADLCARRIERLLASVEMHQTEARGLLSRFYARRDDENRIWSTSLVTRYDDVLWHDSVVALPNLVRDVASPRLAEGRRLFLLVLDGCSVPVFLDLLAQLAEGEARIGLDTTPGRQWRPAIAPLPTITSHARGAIFLGAIPKDPFAAETVFRGEVERTTDPGRFRQNPHIRSDRVLFLKGDLADGGAGLRDALRTGPPLVAAVFNAVDDRIGSHDTGQAWRMDVEDIHGFLPALKTAFEAGRQVLLTADHGHSLFRGTDLRVGAGSTPRYAVLAASETPPDGFVEVPCGDLAGSGGRLAFAWRSGAYRGMPQVGFHGGCSLEEMVVPCAWLAKDGPAAAPPPWWHATPPSAAPLVEPEPAPPAVVVPALRHVDVSRVPQALRDSLSNDGRVAVALVLSEGPVRTKAVAEALGRPPNRVAGFLTKLNLDLAPFGARLVAEALPDHEQQWRYEGPEEPE